MRFTFRSDERMLITIPLGSLRQTRSGHLMPEKFSCVFKDTYKVFQRGQPKALGTPAYKVFQRGQPKALGVCQLMVGVFVISMGVLLSQNATHTDPNTHTHTPDISPLLYTLPSILFIMSGMLSFAAGHTPHMGMMKLSFACNIVCIFWAIAAVVLCALAYGPQEPPHSLGLMVCVCVLLAGEMLVAVVMVYWQSKAVCRDHFNILPTITLKQET
ncbi:membrane-spanning 4-domains subfamily A member 4A [Engraulis encrasicolus]|uniref:membrane-spanning 4-domains subfamily A member 4A n=1 Tax=Engraulis encrasicolus TaxID=184585 RepID=UPI002FD1EA3A